MGYLDGLETPIRMTKPEIVGRLGRSTSEGLVPLSGMRLVQVRDMNGAAITTLLSEGANQLAKIKTLGVTRFLMGELS